MLPTQPASSDGNSVTCFATLGKFTNVLPGKCQISFFHARCIFCRATSSNSPFILVATSLVLSITWQNCPARISTVSIVVHSLCSCKGLSPAWMMTSSAPALRSRALIWRTRLWTRAIERVDLSEGAAAVHPVASSGTIKSTMTIAASTFVLIVSTQSIPSSVTLQPTWMLITAFASAEHGCLRTQPDEKCRQLCTVMNPSGVIAAVLISGCNMTAQSEGASDCTSENVTSKSLSTPCGSVMKSGKEFASSNSMVSKSGIAKAPPALSDDSDPSNGSLNISGLEDEAGD
mmetsp:Transcript_50739/g.142054  ORF Transcript_50739/g.142054 Transcript_50739/m.142054 type:complete len:289 (+) Transcript_50739:2633-3499(+)